MARLRLQRTVRFCVSPFAATQPAGFNHYAGMPTGAGLALYLELAVELEGEADPETGFFINIRDVDPPVRRHAVPLLTQLIADTYRAGRDVALTALLVPLRTSLKRLAEAFAPLVVKKLELRLNPFRRMTLIAEADNMVHYSEKFEFSATHQLWNPKLDDEANRRLFGKCANPSGHGHNYAIEITVKGTSLDAFDALSFQEVIDRHVVEPLDHTNLNLDVPYFQSHNPTIENIAIFAWEQLQDHVEGVALDCIRVWESERSCCAYGGTTQASKSDE